jgi:hypothetical protein
MLNTLEKCKHRMVIDVLFLLCGQYYVILVFWFGLGYGAKRHFQQYCSYIEAVSSIGRGNRRKPPTCFKSQANFNT